MRRTALRCRSFLALLHSVPQASVSRMNIINQILLFIVLFFATACGGKEESLIVSPSGIYLASTEISGNETETKRSCVRIKIHVPSAGKEFQFQTGASDFQKWAIDWSSEDILILYSSDIGIYAYELKSDKIIERLATDEEKEVGRKAYEAKYGRRPIG